MQSPAKELLWNCQISHASSSVVVLKSQMFYIKIILMKMMMMAKYLSLNNRLTKQDSQDWLREQQIATSHHTLTPAWSGR